MATGKELQSSLWPASGLPSLRLLVTLSLKVGVMVLQYIQLGAYRFLIATRFLILPLHEEQELKFLTPKDKKLFLFYSVN